MRLQLACAGAVGLVGAAYVMKKLFFAPSTSAPSEPSAKPAKRRMVPDPVQPDHDLCVPFSELHRLPALIEREGVAIVTGVVDAAELAAMEQDFLDDLTG